MKRMTIWLSMLILLFGGTAVEVRGNDPWGSLRERWGLQRELRGEEIWRKELGRERCLLLYIDEKGERKITFTDGAWMYLTEELVERVKAAGMSLWERGHISMK